MGQSIIQKVKKYWRKKQNKSMLPFKRSLWDIIREIFVKR